MSTLIGYLGTALLTCFTVYILFKAVKDLFFSMNINKTYPTEYANLLLSIFIAIISRVGLLLFSGFVSGEGLDILKIWDGHHYLFIAENGYVSSGKGAEFIVFYPLYPLLIKICSLLFINHFASALFISNICFIISIIYLYKLCSLYLDANSSLFGCLMFIFFPFGIFTSGVYTESLFIMLSLICLYYLTQKKYFVAALAGMFASATRIQGMLLIIPAIYECLLTKKGRKNIAWQLIIPLGFISYLCINKFVFGSFDAFMKYQNEIWYQSPSFLWNNLSNYFTHILNKSELTVPIMLPQLLLFFLFVGIFIWAIKKGLRTSYGLYALPYIIMVYSASWLLSGGRYLMSLVPVYIALPMIIKNKYIRFAAVFISIGLLIFYTYLYSKGRYVM